MLFADLLNARSQRLGRGRRRRRPVRRALLQHLPRPGARLGHRGAGARHATASAPRRACTSATATADRQVTRLEDGRTRDWSHYEHDACRCWRAADIDQVSVECGGVGVDVGVLELLRGKDVLLGAGRLSATERSRRPRRSPADPRRALEHVPSRSGCSLHRLRPGPAQPRSGRGKMRALAAGAAIVNRELTCVAGEVSR